MVPVTTRHDRRDRSEPAPRASTLVLVLTAAAILAGLVVWIIARHLGGAW